MAELAKIMVAPNGARLTVADHPSVPITVDQIVTDAGKCFAEGATAIHAHVRDNAGQHVLDPGLYRELLSEMEIAIPHMDCQISTEAVGRYSPSQQIAVVQAVKPQHVSVGLRELCRDGWTPEIRKFYCWCSDKGVSVQHILYDVGDLDRLLTLAEEDEVAGAALQMLFVLGRYSENRIASKSDLNPFIDRLACSDLSVEWAVCAFGQNETLILRHAMELGGCARIGFENNIFNVDGSIAADNAARIRELLAE